MKNTENYMETMWTQYVKDRVDPSTSKEGVSRLNDAYHEGKMVTLDLIVQDCLIDYIREKDDEGTTRLKAVLDEISPMWACLLRGHSAGPHGDLS